MGNTHLVVISALSVISCRSVSMPTGAGGSSSSSSGSQSASHATSAIVASTSTGQIATVVFSGTIVPNGAGVVAGASVCVYDHADLGCVMTGSDGSFMIGLPTNANTGIQVSHAGFASILIPIQTSSMDQSGAVIGMPKTAASQSYYASGNTAFPNPGKGYLAVFFTPGDNFQMGSPGAVATLVPLEGDGPLYADATSAKVDSTLTATSSAGLARFGAMPPGMVEVDASCAMSLVPQLNFFGWPGSDLSKTTIPIVDGFETRIGFGCY